MRVAVVSDIHANLHALEAVLAEIDREQPDELWCLGDLVGYGPKPNECCRLVRERATLSLCGNHDLGVLGTIDLADFAGDAGVAARWTRTVLGAEERTWLETLSPSGGARRRRAVPRQPARPDLGVRPERPHRPAQPAGDHRAARPGRPQPRPARDRLGRRRPSAAASRSAAPRRRSPARAGC